MRILSSIAGLTVVAMVLMGTWPILFGHEPVDPLIDITQIADIKDDIADAIKDIDL